MRVDQRTWHSPSLGQDMTLEVYGHDGRPVLAFPSQESRWWDFRNWGMVDACAGLIDAGRMRIVAVDGIDSQSWANWNADAGDRARRHEDYDRYVTSEVFPFVRDLSGRQAAWVTGASMGAYHAANLLFRHPDLFDGLIAMSGLYELRMFVGDRGDGAIYFNTPLYYLPNLDDPWYLDRIRAAKIAIAVGQGAWEDEMIADTRALEQVLRAKSIPAIVDYWGHDVNHDWPWWRKMLPHYLEVLGV